MSCDLNNPDPNCPICERLQKMMREGARESDSERVVFSAASFDAIFDDVQREIDSANRKFARYFASPHEAFAILKEEVDELWQEVRAAQKPRHFGTKREANDALLKLEREAIQVAAMAVKMIECCRLGKFGGST